MRVHVLALDYDGTIATGGVLDGDVSAALAAARAAGLVLLLVTGRIRADLERHVDRLERFDGIVGENGAVLYFPAAARSVRLAPPPAPVFLDEMRRRGIPFLGGECVVEIDAARALDTLEVIRELELPLVIQFNRSRAMVLPPATSKGTGLRAALRALRSSVHNTLAIGDAENDHELLRTAAIGVAVEWGSHALKMVADRVLPGAGPGAVAPFLRGVTATGSIEPDRDAGRGIHLGIRPGGEPFVLAARGRTILVTGDSRSGKSWVAGLVCEQLILQQFCVCVIDPEGEYAAIESLPSVVVLDSTPDPPDPVDIERTLRYPDVSVVVDLSPLPVQTKRDYARVLLVRLQELQRKTGLPHRIVVDEAHYFLHDDEAASVLDLDRGGFLLVSYRPSLIARRVIDAVDLVLSTRLSDPDEIAALSGPVRSETTSNWLPELAGLAIGEAALLPAAPSSAGVPTGIVPFTVAPRLTAHVRHRDKYRSVGVPADRAFVFRRNGRPARVARSLDDFVAAIEEELPFPEHLRAHDYSRWIRGVLADRVLAASVETIERRCAGDEDGPAHKRIAEAIRERYPPDAGP